MSTQMSDRQYVDKSNKASLAKPKKGGKKKMQKTTLNTVVLSMEETRGRKRDTLLTKLTKTESSFKHVQSQVQKLNNDLLCKYMEGISPISEDLTSLLVNWLTAQEKY